MLYPERIVGRTQYRPYVSFFFTIISVIVFFYIMLYAFATHVPLEEIYKNYALNICQVAAQPFGETLLDGLRSLFLHISFVHLTANIVIFYVFGSRIEEHLGHWKFLLFYLFAGFASHFSEVLSASHACNEAVYMVGSTGAISGVMGAFLFLFPTVRIHSKFVVIPARIEYRIKVPAFVYLLYWFFMQFFYQVGSVAPQINIHWGHVGGFVAGLAMVFILSFFIPPPRTVSYAPELDD
jgi:membrane associated rhomboid family serine protease